MILSKDQFKSTFNVEVHDGGGHGGEDEEEEDRVDEITEILFYRKCKGETSSCDSITSTSSLEGLHEVHKNMKSTQI